MIDIRQQEEMLIAIGRTLQKKLIVYAIGGTAMMLRGIKNSTLDIDFVFDKKSDRENFISALRKLGAKELNARLVYGLKNETPMMLEFVNCRFDLFLNQIISSRFSENMKKRAKQVHEFGNLIVNVADLNDVLIMKSATSRAKDLSDIIDIVNRDFVNWDVVIDEAEEQVNLGNERAVLALGEKLERLANEKVASVPKKVLDELWGLLKKQVKGRRERIRKR